MSLVLKSDDMYAVAAGSHTTVAAVDTVATGLREVIYAVATLSTDPIATASTATVTIPSQISSAGNITISTWMPTAAGNTAPKDATDFSMVVNWIAIGK